jgi:hypothetical protein
MPAISQNDVFPWCLIGWIVRSAFLLNGPDSIRQSVALKKAQINGLYPTMAEMACITIKPVAELWNDCQRTDRILGETGSSIIRIG